MIRAVISKLQVRDLKMTAMIENMLFEVAFQMKILLFISLNQRIFKSLLLKGKMKNDHVMFERLEEIRTVV